MLFMSRLFSLSLVRLVTSNAHRETSRNESEHIIPGSTLFSLPLSPSKALHYLRHSFTRLSQSPSCIANLSEATLRHFAFLLLRIEGKDLTWKAALSLNFGSTGGGVDADATRVDVAIPLHIPLRLNNGQLLVVDGRRIISAYSL